MVTGGRCDGWRCKPPQAGYWRRLLGCGLVLLLCPGDLWAGAQQEEELSLAVATVMQRSINAKRKPYLAFTTRAEAQRWMGVMSRQLETALPDLFLRERLLIAVHYEASRAGLDAQMVLGLIQVESNFRMYAISRVDARGLMQVMPFWVRQIGQPGHNLFDLNTNLRYGCTILRHYLDIEKGNLFRALGRYNGSLGQPHYPNRVLAAWKQWAALLDKPASHGSR